MLFDPSLSVNDEHDLGHDTTTVVAVWRQDPFFDEALYDATDLLAIAPGILSSKMNDRACALI